MRLSACFLSLSAWICGSVRRCSGTSSLRSSPFLPVLRSLSLSFFLPNPHIQTLISPISIFHSHTLEVVNVNLISISFTWQGILTTLSQSNGEYKYDYATVPFLAEVFKVMGKHLMRCFYSIGTAFRCCITAVDDFIFVITLSLRCQVCYCGTNAKSHLCQR